MPEPSLEAFELSPLQERIWRAAGNRPTWVEVLVRLDGALDAGALERALSTVVSRHEMLRTRFVSLPALLQPVQAIDLPSATPLHRIVATVAADHDDPGALTHESIRLAAGLRGAPGPALHATLVRFDAELHVLVLSLNALCADVATAANLCREVAYFYPTGASAPAPAQYLDYAEWLGTRGSRQSVDPNGAQSPPAVAYQATTLAQAAPGAAAALACCWALVYRRHGSERVEIAWLTDGRQTASMKEILGPCSYAVPMRADVTAATTLAQLLDEAQRQLDRVPAPGDTIFGEWTSGAARIAFESRPTRFVVAGGPEFSLLATSDPDGAPISWFTSTDGMSVLSMRAAADANADLALAASQLVALIAACASIPGSRIVDLPLTVVEESVLERLTGTVAPIDPLCTHTLVEMQAEQTPRAMACTDATRTLTYAELNAEADRVAGWLRGAGVAPEQVVGMSVERSCGALATLLAIWKCGGTCLALDSSQPAPRLRQIVDAARPACIVITDATGGRFEQFGLRLLNLANAAAAGPRPNPRVFPRNGALLSFTSGSTGVPKGIVTEHRGVVNYLTRYLRPTYGLGPGDVVLQLPELTFDAALRDSIGPLICGARVVIVDRETFHDPGRLMEVIAREQVTAILSIVPSVLRLLTGHALELGRRLSSVRLVLASGEVLRQTDCARVRAVFGDAVAIVNQFGPTECTMTSTWHAVPRDMPADAAVAIGRPIANVSVHLLDVAGRRVPVGATGEVYISGAGVTRGYLDSALTAERFLPDPYAEPGARMYRTGDLGRLTPGGLLEFLGRATQEAKVRGVRVHLGDVEAALAAYPPIRDVAVVAYEEPDGDTHLAAYVVPRRRAVSTAAPPFVADDGMVVAQLNAHETAFFHRQIFVERVEWRHGLGLPDDAVVIDVGANVGLFTLFVHRACRGARVFAVEPIPAIADVLRENVAACGIPVEVVARGLGERREQRRFTYYPYSSCQSSAAPDSGQEAAMLRAIMSRDETVIAAGGGDGGSALDALIEQRLTHEAIDCDVCTLSDLIDEYQIDRIDLLKIDAEKSEVAVLRGVRDEHWPRFRQIFIEAHDLSGEVAAIVSLLRARGFDTVAEQDAALTGTCLFNIYARRPDVRAPVPSAALRPLPRTTAVAFDVDGCRAHAETRLPPELRPRTIVVLDALPLTLNGKVDRARLPPPDKRRGDVVEPPLSPTEQMVASIWSAVLKHDAIVRRDSFFELGGHSILATLVASRLRAAFGVDLPLRTLFDHPHLADLAAVIDADMRRARAVQLPALEATDGDGPLSFAQQRLWFLDQLEPGMPAYNVTAAFRVSGQVSVDLLRAALDLVVERQDVLRTTFVLVGHDPVQRVIAAQAPSIEVVDLTSVTQPAASQALADWTSAHQWHRFTLDDPPLLRTSVLRFAPDDHVVLLTVHHIVADGWSMTVLMQDLAIAYRALAAGRAPEWRPLPFRYRDYAAWQRRLADTPAFEHGRRFWKTQLAGVPPLMPLPLDRPRTSLRTFRGGAVAIDVPADLRDRLMTMARREGATLFMALLAAFQTLLYRLSGCVDLLVGCPVANRADADLEPLVGLFINMVPLRGDLRGNPRFRDLLGATRATSLDAFAFQAVPFEALVTEAGGSRSLSHAALVQVTFALQNVPAFDVSLPGVALEPMLVPPATAKFDVSLWMAESRQGMTGAFEFNAELFETATIERIAAGFRHLLEAIVENPEERIDALPLAAPHAVEAQLGATRGPAITIPVEPVHRRFASWARRTPDALAIVNGSRTLTYGEVSRRVAGLAVRLRGSGVGPERVVAIWTDRAPETVVAMLAVLSAGGAYVPIDPSYPEARVRAILADCRPTAIVVRPGATAIQTDVAIVAMDDQVPAECPAAPEETVPLDAAAYVVYTSGSTGSPNGVVNTHRGLAQTIAVAGELYGIEAGQSILQAAAFGFDAAVLEIFIALANGATLVMSDEEERLSAPALEALLRRHRVRWATFTPSMLVTLTAASVPDLLVIAVGGEACSAALARQWAPGRRLVNAYGPTEAAIFATRYVCRGDEEAGPPIGTPLPGTAVLVLDSAMRPLPIGVVGEIYIGGPVLARGYASQPALTAARFVPHPFDRGARLYRTGDLGRVRADGNIEFVGRRDRQVKVRGVRIDIDEVELLLRRHPSCRTAIVRARESVGGPELVAYYLPEHEGARISTGEMRAFLRKSLPDGMCPACLVALDRFPRTAHGKLDEQALPPPDSPAVVPGVPPRTDRERAIAAAWQDVLGLDRPLAIDENFFDAGGHSLLAARLAAVLRQRLDVAVPVRAIFENPTIAELARALADAPPVTRADATIGAEDGERAIAAELDAFTDAEIEAILAELLGSENRDVAQG